MNPKPIGVMKNIIFNIVLSFLTAVFFDLPAGIQPSDSADTASPKAVRRSGIKFTTRLHSAGLFMYGGRIASDNPAIDFNFTYERKQWGYMLFKAFDLYDLHSDNNFTLTLLYRYLHLGKRLTVTPYAGFAIEQIHSICDQGSDVVVILNTTLQLTDNLKLDNTMLLSNLVLENEFTDWVNRYRLLFSDRHLDATLFLWHNNHIFDNSDYYSWGLNASYSRIKVSERVSLSTGVTGLLMAQTSDEQRFPRKSGLVFTIAAVVH